MPLGRFLDELSRVVAGAVDNERRRHEDRPVASRDARNTLELYLGGNIDALPLVLSRHGHFAESEEIALWMRRVLGALDAAVVALEFYRHHGVTSSFTSDAARSDRGEIASKALDPIYAAISARTKGILFDDNAAVLPEDPNGGA